MAEEDEKIMNKKNFDFKKITAEECGIALEKIMNKKKL